MAALHQCLQLPLSAAQCDTASALWHTQAADTCSCGASLCAGASMHNVLHVAADCTLLACLKLQSRPGDVQVCSCPACTSLTVATSDSDYSAILSASATTVSPCPHRAIICFDTCLNCARFNTPTSPTKAPHRKSHPDKALLRPEVPYPA